jgi:hypothetical protein
MTQFLCQMRIQRKRMSTHRECSNPANAKWSYLDCGSSSTAGEQSLHTVRWHSAHYSDNAENKSIKVLINVTP